MRPPSRVRRSRALALLVLALGAMVLPAHVTTTTVGAAGPVGSIAGTVTDTQGNPVPNVTVSADSYYVAFATTTTDALGRYVLANLAVGTYQVQFTPPAGSHLLAEWYNNKHDLSTGANPVTVTAGTTTAGINAVLEGGSAIQGTITSATGLGLANASACVWNISTGANACATTSASGAYTTPALPAGSYGVYFTPPGGSTLFWEYYNDTPDYGSLTPVPVVDGADTVGVNARLQNACTVFGPACTWIRNSGPGTTFGTGCIVANYVGVLTAKLKFTCGASSVNWTDGDGHNVVGNPVTLTYSGVGPWTVTAAANVGGSVTPYQIQIQFPGGTATAPGAPTNVAGVSGNAQVPVSWVAPVSDGGSPITGYTVTATPGGATCSTAGATSCTVTGLTNGTPYTFKVAATNAVGTGPQSAASAPVTPMTVPGAPQSVTATPGNTQAQVSWVAPASNGGSAISQYVVTASPGGATCTTAGALTCTVLGLTNATSYTFVVKAMNAAGYGPASAASAPVIPSTVTPPGAPTGVIATAAKSSASVSWSAPASNGGAPITGYTVTASPGGATCATAALTCVVSGLAAGTPYTFTVVATNSAGPGPASSASNAVTPWDGAGYHPVDPSRILDSRTPTGGWNGKLASGFPRNLQVTGLGGASNVPATASAVVMNVTVTGGSAGSFVSVWPSGVAQPNVSNLNFGANETIPNLVTVKLGSGGKVTMANAVGTVHVIADVVGYYDDGNGPGDLFNGITPTRLLDSRTPTGNWGSKLAAGAPRDLVVRQPGNPAGVPATATAVIANVTVTGGSAGSFVSVWPSGVAQPNVSNLNFAANQTIPNLVVVKIGANGAITFANAVGNVDVIVDVVGYFDPTAGSRFHAITPTRILDDRIGVGLSGPWGPATSRPMQITGVAGIPAGAAGLVANVTATNATVGSFVTVYPDGVAKPNSSNLNFGPNQTIPNLVTVKLAANGKIDLYNELGTVDLIADAVGYYAAT